MLGWIFHDQCNIIIAMDTETIAKKVSIPRIEVELNQSIQSLL